MTLYLNIGGRKAIKAVLPVLQARLEADPVFDPDHIRQAFGQTTDLCEFLVFITGGAPVYDGKPMAELLMPLCRSEEAYGRFAEHLAAGLGDQGAAPQDVTELHQLMQRLRSHIREPGSAAQTAAPHDADTNPMQM